MKPDTTQRILIELEKMIDEGEFSSKPQLESDIRKMIDGVRTKEINLMMEYRRGDSREKYGSEIIEAIITANRRQQESFFVKNKKSE